uniref:Ribonuclease E n=1 Tax=Leachiella pacifica TaxID=282357 RepID=A0A3S8UVW0_9FLOR|nr:ribonuclease E [Leachiella pacifica]
MIKKIIISYCNNIGAIIQNDKVKDIIIINQTYQVNDIYIGCVQKIFSSMDAAFINLSDNNKSGFIHFSNLIILNKIQKYFNIHNILSLKQLILVQVIKEPTSFKGPRLTSDIHLHGRYVTLMPFSNIVLISNKIYDEVERIHLYGLALLIKPKKIGLLIKSSAQKISESAILEDVEILVYQWIFIQKLSLLISKPSLLYKEEDLIKIILRDFYEQNIKKIIIDSILGLKLIYYYFYKWNYLYPLFQTKIQFYKKSLCILDKFYIKQIIQKSLISKVKLFNGGYLFIENYESLTIIDVNSGSFNQSNNSKSIVLKLNVYAAIEISYQLRIRNINGIILIDFINMYSQVDQLQLIKHLNFLLKFDKYKSEIIQLSELGLLEITRQRKTQSLREIFSYSDLKKNNLSSFYFNNNFYSKLYWSMYYKNLTRYSLLDKNIYLLCFNKKFSKNFFLNDYKISILFYFLINSNYYYQYNNNKIYLLSFKNVYIIPYIYLSLIDDLK